MADYFLKDHHFGHRVERAIPGVFNIVHQVQPL